VSQNLNAAAYAAGIKGEDKRRIDNLSKAFATHQNLLNMPQDVANSVYNKLPESQQQNLVDTFGTESPDEGPKGLLGTAWHYTGYQAFKGLQFASDRVSQTYRALAIPIIERKTLGFAWDEAGKDGEKVYNTDRIQKAKDKYTEAQVNIAQKISEGANLSDLIQDATEEEKYYLRIADPTNKESTREEREEFSEALNAVNAAKFSPGRQLANLIDVVTPGNLTQLSTPRILGRDIPFFGEQGFFYKVVSGVGDAIFRLRTDPFIIASKAKKLYDINNYAVGVVAAQAAEKGEKFEDYFNNPKTIALWDQAGDYLKKIIDNKGKDPQATAEARKELSILIPEFGRSVVDEFIKGPVPITNATTAKAWFENTKDAINILSQGSIARQRVILPRMDLSRKARINTLTFANKVFDFNKVSPAIVNAMFGSPNNLDGLYDEIVTMEPGKLVKALEGEAVKGTARKSSLQIFNTLDKIKRSFTAIPIFKDNQFDLLAKDAPDKIYRIAALSLPTNIATLFKEAYAGTDDISRKYSIYQSLWGQVADLRGANLTPEANTMSRVLTQKGNMRTGLGDDVLARKALLPSEMNTVVSAPNLADIDLLAGKSAFARKVLGTANSKWVEDITGIWSFLTLAGPRYAIRNAGEDLMVGLAMGKSVWGLIQQKTTATRLNSAMQTVPGLTSAEKFAANPLGVMMRFLNKKEAETNVAEIKALDAKIVSGREELFQLKTQLRTLDSTSKEAKALNLKIAEVEESIEGGVAGQTRIVLANALSRGKIDNFLRNFNIKLIDDETIDILKDQIIYGDIDNLLSSVSEGGMNFASGATYNETVLQLVKDLGVGAQPLRLDLTTATRQYTQAANVAGFGTRAITSDKSEASLIGWLLRLSFYGNDELGSVALANVDLPEDKAIQILVNWLRSPKGQQLKKEATAVSDLKIDDLTYATRVYQNAKDLVTQRKDGKINTDLLNKIRQLDPDKPLGDTDSYVITGKLGLDDVQNIDIEDMPLEYVGPELIPVVDADKRTSSLIQNGWVWLGLANARISRQPMALYETVLIRKEMREQGFEKAFIDKWTEGIEQGTVEYKLAINNAKKELAKAAEERAITNVLSYVDNPLIRSQISFSMRNFARFYRAQEDFYRRLGRLAKYNPEAFQKAALTFDGIDHNGWIQKDDQGNPYFVYPHFAPGYRAMQGALEFMGIPQDFKVPFPVQFGGSIKMLTPSLNPDSILPTFSGPAAALSISMLANVVDFLPFEGSDKAADTITGMTLGKYAVDRPLIDRLMPAHVNRFLAAVSQDERDSQYASAYRKAVTYLEASGNGIPKKFDALGNPIAPTIAEREAYREKVKNTTLAILAVRFVYGFAAPASPSIQLKSDMAEWVRDSGKASWKQAWYGLLEKNNGDTNAAMQKWVELYPNQVPYTVSESERKTVGFFQSAEDSGKFVEENGELFNTYKEGAAFLIPHKGAFSWDAYRTMKSMGLRENKRVEDYLLEVQTAAGVQTYYDKKDEFDNSLVGISDPSVRKILRQQFNIWKDTFNAGQPLVQEYLGKGREKEIERVNALDDLSKMLDDPKFSNIRPQTQEVLRQMVKAYKDYRKQQEVFKLIGGDTEIIDFLKVGTLQKIRELSSFNENTQAAYMSIFSRLLGEE
jgi:hypothetical protein